MKFKRGMQARGRYHATSKLERNSLKQMHYIPSDWNSFSPPSYGYSCGSAMGGDDGEASTPAELMLTVKRIEFITTNDSEEQGRTKRYLTSLGS